MPLFLSPPIVQLPLTLGVLPLQTVLKYLALIIMGTVVSVISTGLAANALVNAVPTHHKNSSRSEVMRLHGGGEGARPTPRRSPSRSPSTLKIQKTGTSSVLKAAVVGMFLFAGVFILPEDVAGFCLGMQPSV